MDERHRVRFMRKGGKLVPVRGKDDDGKTESKAKDKVKIRKKRKK